MPCARFKRNKTRPAQPATGEAVDVSAGPLAARETLARGRNERRVAQ